MARIEGKSSEMARSILRFAVEAGLGAFLAWGAFQVLRGILGPSEDSTLHELQYLTFLGLGSYLLFRPARSATLFFRALYEGVGWTRDEFIKATGEFLSEILIVAAFVIVTGFYISVDAQVNGLGIWVGVGDILIQIGVAMLAGSVTGVVLAFVGKSLSP